MPKDRESPHVNLNGSASQKGNNRETIIVRAVIYARTIRVDQNTSYVNQVKKCNEYVKQNNWTLCDIYLDEGISGKGIDRPELSQMLLNAAKGCFDIVVVSNADRLSRSLKDLSEMSNILNDFHVKIRSAEETENETLNSNQSLPA
jgi:site-specific DNA recombinase